MPVELDHVLWAAPDLASGTELFSKLTGTKPVTGGRHPGFGTRNTLLGFSPTTYLEIIAPDPEQDLANTLGSELSALQKPKLWLFALATTDLSDIADKARSAGVTVEDPIAMNRTTPDGVRLDWSILRIADPRWPGKLPFFIDWQGSPHPAEMTPGGATLDGFEAIDPNPEDLRALYEAIGCKVPVRGGVDTGFVARLSTPNGTVVLT